MDLPDKDFLVYKALDRGAAGSALLWTLLLVGGSGSTDLSVGTSLRCLGELRAVLWLHRYT